MIFNMVAGGGGGGTVSIEAVNYSVLPATGKQNDIAVLNAQPITETVIAPNAPASPINGMVWIVCAFGGSCYIELGNTKIYLTSAKQYVSGSWVVLGEWYCWNNNSWVRGRYYFIKDGQYYGQTMQQHKIYPNSTDTMKYTTKVIYDSYTQNPIYMKIKNTETSGTRGCLGLKSTNGAWGKYSRIVADMGTSNSPLNSKTHIAIIPTTATYVERDSIVDYTIDGSAITRQTWSINIPQSNDTCFVYVGMTCGYNSNLKHFTIYNLYVE